MTASLAVDLPTGSHVRDRSFLIGEMWKHPHGTAEFPWLGPTVGWVSDDFVQQLLDSGARVLRVGDGGGQ